MPKIPIPDSYQGLPAVTSELMRNLDGMAADKFGLSTLTLMENAGKAVAAEMLRALGAAGADPAPARVVVCCGRGSNGGDGLVAARHLKGMGVETAAFLCPPKKDGQKEGPYPTQVRANLERARGAGVPVTQFEAAEALDKALTEAGAALDALLGTGSSGKPAGAVKDMIQAMTRAKKPVYAVDVPSGINPDTGHHSGVFVTAAETFMLGLPKRGLLAVHAQRYVGRLTVLDIGYPPELAEIARAVVRIPVP